MFSTNNIFSIIHKKIIKIIFRSFRKKIKIMHTNSSFLDVYCHKIWDSNLFCKNSYENNKFILHMHWKTKFQDYTSVYHTLSQGPFGKVLSAPVSNLLRVECQSTRTERNRMNLVFLYSLITVIYISRRGEETLAPSKLEPTMSRVWYHGGGTGLHGYARSRGWYP